jgi:L-proline amide hydrolase
MTAIDMSARGRTAAGDVLEWDGLRTWYKIVDGAPEPAGRGGAAAPVVICHGGPGLTHDYLTSVARLSERGHTCVLYDQVGSGRSACGPGTGPDGAGGWSVELFVRELAELVARLGIGDGYHVLGHSWGGMLALEHAVRRPPGLRSIVVADAFASSATYTREVAGLVAALPDELRRAVEANEAAGTTDSPEYHEAVRFFFGRHGCRRRPIPAELMRTLGALGENSSVYQAMAGPSEFTMTGVLRDWSITDRLGAIAVPALLVSGRHDEVTPACVAELADGLPGSRWVLFEQSSHMPHLEEPELFHDTVGAFLADTVGEERAHGRD